MKTNHPKLKTTPRSALFSCAFFSQCSQTVLSPTTTTPPVLPLNPPQQAQPESSSSSSNTSQSFTQWKFPLSNSPLSHHSYSQPKSEPDPKISTSTSYPPPLSDTNLNELFHVAELQFSTGSDMSRVGALHLLEKSLLQNPTNTLACPDSVMNGVVTCLREVMARKPASKVLLALCLVEENRRLALNAGAVNAVVDALADAESTVAERSLASLELLCTMEEGAAEVRSHALAVPMMVEVMGRMEGRGKEHAISVLAVIYGGLSDWAGLPPAEEVARAVILALQGDCSARGRRKGAQLLKILKDDGRLDLVQQ